MKHFSEISASAERVVDAAEELVQRYGYTGFSYDDVALRVGIKKPSIHHHFPAKADLAAVVAQRYTHRFRVQLLNIDGTCVKASEKLVAYANLFAASYAKDRHLCVCGILAAEADSLPDVVAAEVAQFFRVNLDWLTQVFAIGRANFILAYHGEPAAQADAFLCALEGAMVVGRGMRNARSPADVGQTFLANLMI